MRPRAPMQDQHTVELISTQKTSHTSSIAFQHLPPNSARFSYATEGALFISAKLSTDAVSALRKVWVLIKTVKATYYCLRTNKKLLVS